RTLWRTIRGNIESASALRFHRRGFTDFRPTSRAIDVARTEGFPRVGNNRINTAYRYAISPADNVFVDLCSRAPSSVVSRVESRPPSRQSKKIANHQASAIAPLLH